MRIRIRVKKHKAVKATPGADIIPTQSAPLDFSGAFSEGY